jgi:glutamyl-tRNA reductase
MTTRFSSPLIDRATDEPRLLLVGVDHRCAPLALRERVAYDAGESRALLRRLMSSPDVAEACLLSTCNRTEVYLLPGRDADAYRLALDQVLTGKAPEIEAQGRFYVKRGAQAARHLLEVACGLRSMVLGEPEILGQVKSAARQAEDALTSGAVLQRLLRSAVTAGGRARHETSISAGAVSFGYALADLARHYFDRLDGCSVLMLGAGETARQVARNLIERGVRELSVSNRSRSRAEAFIRDFPECRLLSSGERGSALAAADVVVSTTSASRPVLGRAELERALAARPARPLLVADLGVPRNVEAGAGQLDGLVLLDVDSLEVLISRNLDRRREEVPRALRIIERELELFLSWYRGLAAESLVEALQKRAEEIRRQEVEGVRGDFPAETHHHLERLTRSLVRKLLHHPSTHLRSTRGTEVRLAAARDLFKLDRD